MHLANLNIWFAVAINSNCYIVHIYMQTNQDVTNSQGLTPKCI